ncbi:RNA polymerase sigma factor [Aminobacter sp. UC22_36]|uniref:RNA polymerase sigma factor n=1 Tax=Aminobacter sp. UC22_36 TaxID=3374549 RepID=UPI003757F060
MSSAASSAVAMTRALDSLVRNDRGRLMSALIARLGSFQLAEDALQDAMVSAVSHWSRNGVPHSPQGWLLQTAYRKAVDRIRQNKSEARKVDGLRPLLPDEAADDPDEIPDERLRLIFTCCHPALETKSQVALTLRTIAGLSTIEIARAFLDAETTMGQRLSRAKAKIAAARIPYAVPEPEEWATRLQSVLAVIYLIFTSGYAAGPGYGRDLAEEALFLCRLLNRLHPDDPEIEGCLALLLITHARCPARVDADGVTVALAKQDRTKWDRAQIDEGLGLIDVAMQRRAPGPYQIKAAIAACHVQGDASDWPQIVLLYDSLLRLEPTAVVRLNRAVALSEAGWLEAASRSLDALASALKDYQPYHAARAELLSRMGNFSEAAAAYAIAIDLASSVSDAAFLRRRAQHLARQAGSA